MEIFLIGLIAVVVILVTNKRKKDDVSSAIIIKDTEKQMPIWEKVILEDGSEFWKLKDSPLPKEAMSAFPYRKKFILTKAEYSFWRILKEKCDQYNVIICPKVRMEDFIDVNEGDFRKRQSYRGRIKSRHIDFMLCDNKLNILAGIELDDNSHFQEENKEVDMFKNQVFNIIKIPLYRVVMKSGYYECQIEGILKEVGIIKVDERKENDGTTEP